jgi:hypothetical protein
MDKIEYQHACNLFEKMVWGAIYFERLDIDFFDLRIFFDDGRPICLEILAAMQRFPRAPTSLRFFSCFPADFRSV